MSINFLHLDDRDRKEILETLAATLGRQAAVLEKDVWVCWALASLFSMENAHRMAFKGGTSLSKIFNAINRFSEDVDITIDYRELAHAAGDNFDPFAMGTSKNQISKFSERLKVAVKEYAINRIIPHIQSGLNLFPGSDSYSLEISDDGEKIWLNYPSAVESSNDYLKSSILIELGGRNVVDPSDIHTVTPDIAEQLPDLDFTSAHATVLAPERTFWEKATLMHAECNRGVLRASAERLSRHWYDLHMLMQGNIAKSALPNRELLSDVVEHKKRFYRSGFADYDACINGEFKLIPGQEMQDELRKDYENMQGMLYGEIPNFGDILSSLKDLEKALK